MRAAASGEVFSIAQLRGLEIAIWGVRMMLMENEERDE